MKRRGFLASVAALSGVAGCSYPLTTPTETPEFTTTYTAKSFPGKPSTLTAETVREFVVERETACLWNELLSSKSERLDTGVSEIRLNETESGYIVQVEIAGSETTPAAHADYEYSVNYFVNETMILRTATYQGEFPGPDPRDEGKPINRTECYR